MRIELDGGYVLHGDQYCYWLTKIVQPEDQSKKEYERRCSGYFVKAEDCFTNVLARNIGDNDAESIKELIKHIDKAKKDLKKAAKGLTEKLKNN